jgi:hypothetical protein
LNGYQYNAEFYVDFEAVEKNAKNLQKSDRQKNIFKNITVYGIILLVNPMMF